MKRQNRRKLVWACSCAVLISNSVFVSPPPVQAADPITPQDTELMMGAFVTVMAMATGPYAPIALGAAKAMKDMMGMLGFFKKPDVIGEAIKAINTRLDAIETRMGSLERDIQENTNADFRRANHENTRELRGHRDALEKVLLGLENKSADKNTREKLVLDAKQVCNALMEDDKLWEWSDVAARDIKVKPNANEDEQRQNTLIRAYLREWNKGRAISKGQMMAPNFKPLPTLELYAVALATWMTAMEFAGNGDTAYVKRTYNTDLQRHIDFLTVRQDWKDTEDEPQTLAEKIQAQVGTLYVPTSRWPDKDQECGVAEYTIDSIARETRLVGNSRYVARSARETCFVPEGLLKKASPKEETLEEAYGMEVVVQLAKQLTSLRDRGTLREQFIGTFDSSLTPDAFNILYTVSPDGTLTWHRHQMRYARGTKTVEKHTWVQPKKVGDGWKAAFKDAYPAGLQGIYTLSHEGELRRHWHTGAFDGSHNWAKSLTMGTGWGDYHKIIPMDHGVVYTILKDGTIGTLRWHQHHDYKKGNIEGSQGWTQPKDVSKGWRHQYIDVFSGGNGVLYGITLDGQLMWHRHKAYLKPVLMPENIPQNQSEAIKNALRNLYAKSWEGPKKVGDGWHGFTKIFSPGEGHIYAIQPNGDLMYYRHTAWETGEYTWDEDSKGKIATGWDGYASAWARSITSDEDGYKGPN